MTGQLGEAAVGFYGFRVFGFRFRVLGSKRQQFLSYGLGFRGLGSF